jgi:hypothetical protein
VLVILIGIYSSLCSLSMRLGLWLSGRTILSSKLGIYLTISTLSISIFAFPVNALFPGFLQVVGIFSIFFLPDSVVKLANGW